MYERVCVHTDLKYIYDRLFGKKKKSLGNHKFLEV